MVCVPDPGFLKGVDFCCHFFVSQFGLFWGYHEIKRGIRGSWIGEFETVWVWLKRAWDFGGFRPGPWVFEGYGFLLSLFCLLILFVLGLS